MKVPDSDGKIKTWQKRKGQESESSKCCKKRKSEKSREKWYRRICCELIRSPKTIKDFLPTSYNTLSILRDKKLQNVQKNRIVYFSLTGKYFIGIVFLSIRNILETILGKYFNSNLICWVLQFMRTINWNRAVINGGVANEPKSNLDVWRSWIQQWSNINFQDYLQSSHLGFRAIWFGGRALSDENDGKDGDDRDGNGQRCWRGC